MQEEFEKAAEDAKTLPDGTSNDDKLKLYGLYKQGTVGDVNTGKPGIFDQKGENSLCQPLSFLRWVFVMQKHPLLAHQPPSAQASCDTCNEAFPVLCRQGKVGRMEFQEG